MCRNSSNNKDTVNFDKYRNAAINEFSYTGVGLGWGNCVGRSERRRRKEEDQKKNEFQRVLVAFSGYK